jgi:hypothetical protein
VLLADTFERRQGLSGWLRDRFLPQLPIGALVVIAGRDAPDPRWTADPGWSEVLHVVALPELTREEATALLAGRGVPESLCRRLLEFADGNPAIAVRDGASVRNGTVVSVDRVDASALHPAPEAASRSRSGENGCRTAWCDGNAVGYPSGLGREDGLEALDAYTESKAVLIAL